MMIFRVTELVKLLESVTAAENKTVRRTITDDLIHLRETLHALSQEKTSI